MDSRGWGISGEYDGDSGVNSVDDSGELYGWILRIIGLNTGGLQPETISVEVLIQHCTHANFDSAVVRQVLSELVKDGVVVEEEGGYRLPSE